MLNNLWAPSILVCCLEAKRKIGKQTVMRRDQQPAQLCRVRDYRGSPHSTTSPKVTSSVFALEGSKLKQTWNVCLNWSTAPSGKKISGAFAVIFVTYGICWLKLLGAHCFRKFRSPSMHAKWSSLQYLGCQSKLSRELHAWNAIKDEELNQHSENLGWWLRNFWMFQTW